MPYATASDGTRLYYKDWGSGRPVVLMHGWPLSGDTFDATALALAENGFRAIVPDRRGFGRSDQPWDGYDYDTFTNDVTAVLDAAGVSDRIAIAGFSMGGGEVARFVRRHADRVSHAVLIGSVVPLLRKTDDNPDGLPADAFDDAFKAVVVDKAEFFRGFLDDFFGKGWAAPVSDAAIDNAWRQAMTAGLKPILGCARAFFETDFRSDLKSFAVPTLIIHGTEDRTVPVGIARAAANFIEGAKLIEYEDGAHGLFESHGERLNRDLLEFLES